MKNKKLWWQSSYDRGVDILLELWPKILEKHPEATLDICYGWDLFDKVAHNNPERLAWKTKVDALMNQKGITHHGRIGKKEMGEIRKQCGILAYPTYFTEIFMIGAVEAQKDGLVPVVSNLGALSETAKTGFLVEGDIRLPDTKQRFLETLLKVMDDKKLWNETSKKCREFAKQFDKVSIAKKWHDVFITPQPKPKVTIYTPTIRDGFWNVMSNNIANQTYKNVEWLIVDDHKDNRAKTAMQYSQKYGIEIRYVRGKEPGLKRNYALSNANNTMMEHAKGELIVFLQDFVLMPKTGIEQAVDFYIHHPRDLYAPLDVYHQMKVKPDQKNKEDWFNGELNVIGEFIRSDRRYKNGGFKLSNIDFDYEQNYGAIPLQVVKDLNGWWEFFDDALGYDNTEIAKRALAIGSKIYVDESNIAICLDHWETVGVDENGTRPDRTINLNDPRYVYLHKLMKKGLSPVRNVEMDNKTRLLYEIPEEVKKLDKEQIGHWAYSHAEEIAERWLYVDKS